MAQYMRRLYNEICAKIEYNYVVSTKEQQQFMGRLENLDFLERAVLAEKVYQLQWNPGSSEVYESLQSVGITEISVLLLRQTDPDCVENILNDLIEHSPILLASLVNACCCPSKVPPILQLRTHFDEYFEKLVTELTTEDPNAVASNYLESINTAFLPAENLQEFKITHLKLFLATSKSTAHEAISQQKEWVSVSKNYEGTTLNGLMRACIAENAALTQLLELITKDPNFDGWSSYLMFVSISATQHNIEIFKIFKTFLKETFTTCVARKSQHLFHVLMLTARQLTYSAAAKFNDYQKWYKDTIGEMVYSSAKITVDSFEFVMSMLSEMIQFECDPDLVNVHIHTAIAAPPKCNELVLTFKQRSRSHLEKSREPTTNISLSKTLTIFEDDDDVMIIDD